MDVFYSADVCFWCAKLRGGLYTCVRVAGVLTDELSSYICRQNE